jgi:two-component system sensor histidine kinase KdpD
MMTGVSRVQGAPSLVRLPRVARVAIAAAGIGVVWIAVLVAERAVPVDLTVVLLLLLVPVLAAAVVTGPVLAVTTAVAAVVLVNWYLVPPYGTFEIASTGNLVALLVFGLLAALTSLLVEASARIQAAAVRERTQTELLGDVVTKDAADGELPLERVRAALELDRLTLVRDGGSGVDDEVLSTTGSGPELPLVGARALDVVVPGGYRLVGAGPRRMAADPRFVQSLAAAAVRSYESDVMQEERERADELSAVDQARTALLASVGHDLRTPLAGLRLAVDALRSPVPLDPATSDDLWETVEDSTTRLDELISNLLDMGRLEAGVLVARVQPTALDAAVAGALLGRPQAPVEVEVPDDLPLVLADPVLLERVVENLVSNALRYAAPTHQSPVQVLARRRGAAVELDVVDHGPGLGAAAVAPTPVLSPGGGADSSTGLGLAIVRGFAHAMDVHVELRETAGGGLTARVSLPAVEA